jgi:hypothetical protein
MPNIEENPHERRDNANSHETPDTEPSQFAIQHIDYFD